MNLGRQLQSFTDAGQASSISKVPKSSIRQRIGILACQETWRHKTTCPQCSKNAKVLGTQKCLKQQKEIAVVLFHAGIYCGIFEIVFMVVQKKWRRFDSRSHSPPPHTHNTTTWKRMWRRQSFTLVETAVKHLEAEVKFAKILIQASYPFSSKE